MKISYQDDVPVPVSFVDLLEVHYVPVPVFGTMIQSFYMQQEMFLLNLHLSH
jgi:hypothetical protein